MKGGKYVLQCLNDILTKYRTAVQKGFSCAKLSLSKVVSARSRMNRRSGRFEYLFIVETLPGKSMFEISVNQADDGNGFGVLGDISRINMYGFQSHCTDDWKLKKHCYCVKKNTKIEQLMTKWINSITWSDNIRILRVNGVEKVSWIGFLEIHWWQCFVSTVYTHFLLSCDLNSHRLIITFIFD